MKKEYDFSKMPSKPNHYAEKLKQQITIRIRKDVVSYFKDLASETGTSYQNLIDSYLADCMMNQRKPKVKWS